MLLRKKESKSSERDYEGEMKLFRIHDVIYFSIKFISISKFPAFWIVLSNNIKVDFKQYRPQLPMRSLYSHILCLFVIKNEYIHHHHKIVHHKMFLDFIFSKCAAIITLNVNPSWREYYLEYIVLHYDINNWIQCPCQRLLITSLVRE